MLTEQQLERRRASHKKYYDRVKNTPEYKARLAGYKHKRYKRLKQDPANVEKWAKENAERYQRLYKSTDAWREKCVKATQTWRERKQEIRKKLQAELGGKCVKCGIDDYRLLDFDHIDPKTKTMHISRKLNLPFETLLEEAKKCQLLCANCHRIKTIETRQFDPRSRKYRVPKVQSSFS
jgi:hypothetical protein